MTPSTRAAPAGLSWPVGAPVMLAPLLDIQVAPHTESHLEPRSKRAFGRLLKPLLKPLLEPLQGQGIVLILLVLLLLPSQGLTAEAQARLNQRQVYEGDQVLLTIEVAGRSLGQEPDLTPLDADFDLGGVSTSQQTQFVNGRRSDKTSWQVALLPKRLGRLSIPPIQVGSVNTEPLSLLVEAVPEGGLGAPGDLVWLEVEIGADHLGTGPSRLADGGSGQSAEKVPDQLVVQQQVPLVVRAYSARPLLDYVIELPAIEGAVLTRIGRDQGSLTTRAGEQYRVIERRYSLNPERSGTLRIPPIIFEAELKTDSGRRTGPGASAMSGMPDLFDDPMIERMLGGMRIGVPGSMFERGEPARAQSRALTLEVAPSAAGFSGEHWLPATALEVDDAWNPADGGEVPRLAVGEPATRILTLTARGLAGNQIPDIEIPAPTGFRVYPGQTESETRSDGETLIGISRQQLTLIPTKGGEVELPRIEVPWWDTEAGQERIAIVPALTLSVAGRVAGVAAAESADALLAGDQSGRSSAAGQSGAIAGLASEDEGRDKGKGETEGAEDAAGLLSWLFSLGGLLRLVAFLLLVGVVVGLLWRLGWLRLGQSASSTERRRQPEASRPLVQIEARRAREALRTACQRDDPRAAAAALLAWAGWLWPDDPPRGLSALAERAKRGPAQIRALERTLYGAPEGQVVWRGEALWTEVKAGLAPVLDSSSEQADQLAPLYPRRDNGSPGHETEER